MCKRTSVLPISERNAETLVFGRVRRSKHACFCCPFNWTSIQTSLSQMQSKCQAIWYSVLAGAHHSTSIDYFSSWADYSAEYFDAQSWFQKQYKKEAPNRIFSEHIKSLVKSRPVKAVSSSGRAFSQVPNRSSGEAGHANCQLLFADCQNWGSNKKQ